MCAAVSSVRIKTKLTRDDRFKVLLALVWLRTSVVSYCFSFFKMIPLLGEFTNIFKILVYIAAVLFALPYIEKEIKLRDLVFLITVLLLYYLNLQIFPNTSEYLVQNATYILGVNFAAYFIGVSMIDNENDHIEFLYSCTKVAVIAFLLYFALFGFTPEEGRNNAENMGLAYRILPHACLITLFAFKKQRGVDIVLAIVAGILVLACGTRGAVLSLAAFILVYLVFFHKVKYRWLLLTIGAILLLVGYYNFNQIASLLVMFLNKFGLSTRVIERMLEGSTLVDEPRERIKGWMMSAIIEHPFRGYGIAGDRNLIPTVVYAHSFWLEMWVSYGVIFGSLFMLVIAIFFIKAIIKADDTQKGFIITMVFGGGLFKLLVSSSYLLEFQFFMLIGYLVCCNRERKKE